MMQMSCDFHNTTDLSFYSRFDSPDAKEFSTFMRYFCTRFVQSLVQSRMGKLEVRKCCPTSEHQMWFDLVIDEIGEVAATLKSNIKGSYPPSSSLFSLDFMLYTANGETLPLESWIIKFDSNLCDESVDIRTNFYIQLNTLLKSVISASRATPTARYYVRNQCSETFIITYKVYIGHSDVSLLGDDRKYLKMGFLPSPFGTITVELHYRTKMELQPTTICEQDVVLTIPIRKSEKIQIDAAVIGNPVPSLDSERIAVSPSSLECLNMFSTSPVSQGGMSSLDSDYKRPSFKLGKSLSSTDEPETARFIHYEDGLFSGFNSSSGHSPFTINSLPDQRFHKPIRVRNNSCPFYSILIGGSSQSSIDKIKVLEKVPENAPVFTNQENSNCEISVRRNKPIARGGSTTSVSFISRDRENVEGKFAQSLPEKSSPLSQATSSGRLPTKRSDQSLHHSSRKKVLFSLSGNTNESEELGKTGQNSDGDAGAGPSDDEDDEEINASSDDSFVKVVPFTSSNPNFGMDLTEFYQDVNDAPDRLNSFKIVKRETVGSLDQQIGQFNNRKAEFDDFVTGLSIVDK